MTTPTSGLELLIMLALYGLAAMIAYYFPRYVVASPDFSKGAISAIGAIALLDVLAFWIALSITPPDLNPLTVASVLTLTATAAGIYAGIKRRHTDRTTLDRPHRAIRLRQ